MLLNPCEYMLFAKFMNFLILKWCENRSVFAAKLRSAKEQSPGS